MSDAVSTIVGIVVVTLLIFVLVQLSGDTGAPQMDFQQDFPHTWNVTQDVLRSHGYRITSMKRSEGRITFEKSLSPTEASDLIDADIPADRIHEAQAIGEAIVLPIEGGGTRVKIQLTKVQTTEEPAPPDLEPSNFVSFLAEYIADPEQYRELQETSHDSDGTAERAIMDLLSDRLTPRSSSFKLRSDNSVPMKG